MSNSCITKRKLGGDKGRSPTKNVGQQQQAMLVMQQGINMRGSIGSLSRDEDELDMNEDDGDGEEDDGGDDSAIKGEELNYYHLDVPIGVREYQLQHILDCHFYPAGNGACKPPIRSKRHQYDNKKLARVFPNSTERKNWHVKFTKLIDEYLLRLVEKNPELKQVPMVNLPMCIVDLRACIGIENINWFYETLFSWSLTYTHMSRFLAGEEAIPKMQYLRCIHLIGHQKHFEYIRLADIVFLPDKPVSKLRNSPKKKIRGNDILEGFAIVAGGVIQLMPVVSESEADEVTD
ncbi:hypothetical protein L211DRAFT_852780 [Terfezia boudieri ATCC MYA-4762]|uniref:Uncharacterized protein n=1 Tax=Terfezia boudieri ATCC MYA-4762 TaxID=1051890 RepID=A0A3N4LAI3_9PEZI|nr:hypothetical protein L211DRAFT_852780 [Terfezia boudieri ATCC MYA-4762]